MLRVEGLRTQCEANPNKRFPWPPVNKSARFCELWLFSARGIRDLLQNPMWFLASTDAQDLTYAPFQSCVCCKKNPLLLQISSLLFFLLCLRSSKGSWSWGSQALKGTCWADLKRWEPIAIKCFMLGWMWLETGVFCIWGCLGGILLLSFLDPVLWASLLVIILSDFQWISRIFKLF